MIDRPLGSNCKDRSPRRVGQQKCILGWEIGHRKAIGFHPSLRADDNGYDPVTYQGDGHIVTIAPTGSGKFVSVVGPVLSEYPGNATLICLDPKGECYHVWARRRRELGQRVILIDPFCKVRTDADCLNPLDLFKLPGALLDSDSEMLASCLSQGHEYTTDRYWTDTGLGLVSGILRYLVSLEESFHSFDEVRKFMYQDDVDYSMATQLDLKVVPEGLARDEFVAYLQIPTDKTRPCVLSTARTFLKSLGGKEAAALLSKSTFSLIDVCDGKPMAIFIVFPYDKMASHKNLLRLLLQVLFTAIGRRDRIPKHPSLFLLEEAASLGDLPALREAMTLFRGVGVIVHSIWQNVAQIKAAHPTQWETILSNCGILQVFNAYNPLIAETASQLLGCSARELMTMPQDEQATFIQRRGLVRSRRLDYLHDPHFAGKFDPNPLYEQGEELDSDFNSDTHSSPPAPHFHLKVQADRPNKQTPGNCEGPL